MKVKPRVDNGDELNPIYSRHIPTSKLNQNKIYEFQK